MSDLGVQSAPYTHPQISGQLWEFCSSAQEKGPKYRPEGLAHPQ